MARYRKIDTRIWNDAKFNALSERGKLVFFFELTHPNMTMLGAMRATVPGLASELGMPVEAFAEAFREILSKGMGKHDPKASFFWLPNFLRYNRPESPNVVRSWPDAFDLLPECSLKLDLFQQVRDFTEGLTKGFREAFIEAFAKDLTKGMPNQEPEPEPEPKEQVTPNARAMDPPTSPTPTEPPLKSREDIAEDIAAGSGIWERPTTGEELMAAVWLFEELGLANSFGDRQIVAQVIAFEARSRGDTQAAAQFLLAEARGAMARGEIVNVFWFKDRKFSPEYRAKMNGDADGANQPSPTKQRVDGNRKAIAKVLERRGILGTGAAGGADGRALPEPGSDGFTGGVLDGFRAAGVAAFPRAGSGGAHGSSNPPRPEILPPAG